MAKRSDGRTRLGRFSKGTSGNPSGVRRDAAAAPPAGAPPGGRGRRDDWQNFFTGMGVFGKDKRVGAQFNLHPLSFDQLKDLWLGDDLAARSVETIPKEAMRQGYDLTIASPQDAGVEVYGAGDPAELASEVTQKLDILGADEYLEICGGYERGYGGSALLIGANDGQTDMTQPLNLNNVKSLDWLTPLEARELMPIYAYSDPRAPKYGQPEIYQLMSRSVLPSYNGNYAATTMMIHESRLIVFPGIRVSRYQVTNGRGGWGESVLTRVYRVLRDFNSAWSSAGTLVNDFAQSVIKIAGLWEALGTDGSEAFQNRLAAMEYGRSTVNAVTIDAGDDYSRQQTPLSGLPDLLEKFAVRLAAACDMPLTLLFGTSPAGMNATGESDIRFFYDRVSAYQKRKMEPAIRRLCQVIFHTLGDRSEPAQWQVKFRPLWQESAAEKATAFSTMMTADATAISAGIYSPEEAALAHWGKGEFDANITIDFAARDAQQQVAAQPVQPDDLQAMDPSAEYEYQPPPEPGSAEPGDEVPPPGEPAAPDPETSPQIPVAWEDSADDEDRYDEFNESDHPRASDGKFGQGSGSSKGAKVIAAGRAALKSAPKTPDARVNRMKRSPEAKRPAQPLTPQEHQLHQLMNGPRISDREITKRMNINHNEAHALANSVRAKLGVPEGGRIRGTQVPAHQVPAGAKKPAPPAHPVPPPAHGEGEKGHGEAHGEGEKGHGKNKVEEFGKKVSEKLTKFTEGTGEIVAGEEATQLASQLSLHGGEEGHGEEHGEEHKTKHEPKVKGKGHAAVHGENEPNSRFVVGKGAAGMSSEGGAVNAQIPRARRGDDFNEADHPRAADGKFGEGSGSPKRSPAEAAALRKATKLGDDALAAEKAGHKERAEKLWAEADAADKEFQQHKYEREKPEREARQKVRVAQRESDAREESEAALAAAREAMAKEPQRRPLAPNAPDGWSDKPVQPGSMSPEAGQKKVAKLRAQQKDADWRESKEIEKEIQKTLKSSYQPGSRVPVTYDNLDAISRPGHLYRGMEQAEFDDTVGKGAGVLSRNDYSIKSIEGTSFGYDASMASSYVNTGESSPKHTGKPNYIVEVRASDHITYNAIPEYPQSARGLAVPQSEITRIWKVEPDGGELFMQETGIPEPRTDDFDESKHPRAADGKFGEGGGSGGGKAPKAASPGASAKDTQAAYHHGGKWRADRVKIHDAYTKSVLAKVPKSKVPTVYMTGGGPASGKTSGLLENKLTKIPGPTKAAHIDPDGAKKHIPEYNERVAAGDMTAAAFVHEESSHMAKSAVRTALTSGHDVVYDSVGDSGIEKLTKKVNEMRAAGAERVVAHYATVDVDEAIKRSDARALKTNRFVPHEYIRQAHADVTNTVQAAIKTGLYDKLDLWDTTGRTPVHILTYEKGAGLEVHDQAAYDRFKTRGAA